MRCGLPIWLICLIFTAVPTIPDDIRSVMHARRFCHQWASGQECIEKACGMSWELETARGVLQLMLRPLTVL